MQLGRLLRNIPRETQAVVGDWQARVLQIHHAMGRRDLAATYTLVPS